jgi:hypothetical protein
MTPQEHIDAIGAAQVKLEALVNEMLAIAVKAETVAKRTEKQARRVHFLQDRAQRAFKEVYPEDNVVLFSGGNSKPPVDDPDGPIKP